MATTPWTLQDAWQHYFIYFEQEGAADLLHELRASPIAANADVNKLAVALCENLKTTALATSAPYYTSMLGTHTGHAATVQQLIDVAQRNRDRSALAAAVTVLSDTGAFIRHSFEPLRQLHTTGFAASFFQALMQQAIVMAWSAFESFLFDLFRLVVTSDHRFLGVLIAAQTSDRGKRKIPWDGIPKALLDWSSAQPTATASDRQAAFDAYPKPLPTLQLEAARYLFSALFPTDVGLLGLLNARELTVLSSRRHLLVHSAGIVDAEYVAASKEPLNIGSRLSVTPGELVTSFRSVSKTAAALAQSTSAIL